MRTTWLSENAVLNVRGEVITGGVMWTEQKQLFVDASAKAFIEVMPLSLKTAEMRAAELLGAIEAKNENTLTIIVAAALETAPLFEGSGEEFVSRLGNVLTRAFLGEIHDASRPQFDVRRSDGALYPFAIPSRKFM